MKKFALLAGLFVFAPMTWAQDYNIKNGLPSETYITCAEANEMAKTDSAQVAEIVELGELDPEHIITPGIFVQHVVRVQPAQ